MSTAQATRSRTFFNSMSYRYHIDTVGVFRPGASSAVVELVTLDRPARLLNQRLPGMLWLRDRADPINEQMIDDQKYCLLVRTIPYRRRFGPSSSSTIKLSMPHKAARVLAQYVPGTATSLSYRKH